jgi:hypothetical protein
MTDALKANWAVARRYAKDALAELVEPDLAKETARERAIALRDRLGPDTQLLTARSPRLLETLFRPLIRD